MSAPDHVTAAARTADRVTAVGGARTVPPPDPIARSYLFLALRLDQHDPGLVEGYVGPADLKARVDLERLPSPGRLRLDAAALRAQVVAGIVEGDRRAWLEAQLAALEHHAAALAGDVLPVLEAFERAYQVRPSARPDAELDSAAAALGDLLPGDGPLEERLASWDARLLVDPHRSRAVAEWLVPRLRERAAVRFGLPPGEAVGVAVVRHAATAAHGWFEGSGRSRVDIRLDPAVAAPELAAGLAMETYGGRHLERSWKEATQVEAAGRLEATAELVPVPAAILREGLARVGTEMLLGGPEGIELLAGALERAGHAEDPARGRAMAALAGAVAFHRRRLDESLVNAALLLHRDGAPVADALESLRLHGRVSEAAARQRLASIEDACGLMRALVAPVGRDLVRRWVELGAPEDRDERFGRLLREAMTPGQLAADLQAGTGDGAPRGSVASGETAVGRP